MIFAESIDDVAAAVRICSEHRVPVIPFGAGSSIEGHLLAVRGGISIDLSRMDRVLEIRSDDLAAIVDAGVTREALNKQLQDTGLFFPVDPGANATLGGMCATRASGTNAVRYGTMRDNVLAMKVVTADGEVINTGSLAKKSAAGYDLTRLFIGSEGTLGIIVQVTVRLYPLPESIAAAVVNFPTVHDAVQTVVQSIQYGIPIARSELLDPLTIRALNRHSQTSIPERPTLFLEFHGAPSSVNEHIKLLSDLVQEHGGGDFDWAVNPEDRSRLWKARHQAFFAALQLKPGARSFTTDACVPISALAQCIEDTIADTERSGLPCPLFGHVGDGNFHCMILADPDDRKEMERAEELNSRIMQRAIRAGGTCTGEHGVGLRKVGFLEEEHGTGAVRLMRRIKCALDPFGIMNPDKVIRIDEPVSTGTC